MRHREINMGEIKRQIYSVCVVLFLLFLLFKGNTLIQAGQRLVAGFSPSGLTVSYFKDTELKHYVCSRTERKVGINYENGRPAWQVPRDGFSARWEGILIVPENDEYVFYLQSEDGSRLFINNELIVDHWASRRWVPGMKGSVALDEGRHVIRIEHVDHGGRAAIRLRWTGGPIPPNTVLAVPYIWKR